MPSAVRTVAQHPHLVTHLLQPSRPTPRYRGSSRADHSSPNGEQWLASRSEHQTDARADTVAPYALCSNLLLALLAARNRTRSTGGGRSKRGGAACPELLVQAQSQPRSI